GNATTSVNPRLPGEQVITQARSNTRSAPRGVDGVRYWQSVASSSELGRREGWQKLQRSACERKRDLQRRTSGGRAGGDDAAIVKDDNLLDECEAETGAVALGREKRLGDALAQVHWNCGAIVRHRSARRFLNAVDLRVIRDLWRHGCARAGIERVPQQVAERLAQQHFVSVDDAEISVDRRIPAGRSGVGPNLVGRTLADRPQ